MRWCWCMGFAISALAQAAAAQPVPAFPPGAIELEARLLARAGPQTRAWVRQEGAQRNAADAVSREAAMRSATERGRALGAAGGQDIEALAFLVLMEAAKSAREDLKAIMDGVKRINDAKASASARRSAQPRASIAGAGDRASVTPAPRPASGTTRVRIEPRPLPRGQIDSMIDKAKNDLDSLSEMGEMESLRLQMAMDRLSRMMSTLSNLLKKVSDTASSITQNLK
ncbi:hypothetical protein BURK1_03356 [Burkholderiales bacterium]|nr:hypothetical protein BURK1_03356 [Burkholderiales bacterium]